MEFYERLILECELICNPIDDSTKLEGLEGYDSLTVLMMIAFIDENFNLNLSASQFEGSTTLLDLAEQIGLENFHVE